jgi:uncharacterized protein (DUF1800 family)
MSLPPATALTSWTSRDAAHLLRRTHWGASAAELDRATADGLEKTLDRLLTPPAEDQAFRDTAALLRQSAEDADDLTQLKAWWLYRMTAAASPLTEKMTLFWHNHFATSNVKVRSPKLMAAQNDLFRTHALGDFKALLTGIARDPAMLLWLDGNANRLRSPNENFARELMELFTLGVGHYSERDIQEAARAFTGWHVRNHAFWINRLQQDPGSKQVFGKTGARGGDDILRLCLAHDACPRFLAGKLLREFVMPAPPAAAVTAVAESLRRHNFHILPVLRELLSSELFFSPEARHSLIKSPIHYLAGTCRSLEVRANLKATVQISAQLGQDLFQPPTVKGWEGGRLWITSATLLRRANYAAQLVFSDTYGQPAALAMPLEQAARCFLEDEAGRKTAAAAYEKATGSHPERMKAFLHALLTLPQYQLA